MQRKGLRVIITILSILLFCNSPLFSESTEYLRIASSKGIEHPEVKALKYLAKLLERRSGGKLKSQVTSNQDNKEIIDQLTFGGIAIASIDLDRLLDYFPELNGAKKEDIESILLKNDLIYITSYKNERRGIFLNSDSFSSFKNLNIGSIGGSHYVRELRGKNASIMALDLSDTASLLMENSINAVYSPLLDFASSNAYTITKSVVFSDFDSLPSLLLINKDIYYSLSSEERELINISAKLSEYYETSLLRRSEETLLERLKKEKACYYV